MKNKYLIFIFLGIFFTTLASADTQSLQIRFIVPDQTPPTFTNLRNLTGYTNQAFTRYITATDDVAVDCYSLNDTSAFDVDCEDGSDEEDCGTFYLIVLIFFKSNYLIHAAGCSCG